MAASAVYRIQARVAGSYRGGIPYIKVAGRYKNPLAVFVKVAGVWRRVYSQFTFYYYWWTGSWSGCACVGCYNTRTARCQFNPTGAVVSDSYCAGTSKPSTSEYCNCNCNCQCC